MISILLSNRILFKICAHVFPGTTTLSKLIPTLAYAMRITSPISSSSGVLLEWPCFMESCWMVGDLIVKDCFDIAKLAQNFSSVKAPCHSCF